VNSDSLYNHLAQHSKDGSKVSKV